MKIDDLNFYLNDAKILSKLLLGKILCISDGKSVKKFKITETECYLGPEDSASHAAHGKTKRAKIMWERGGTCYIYLSYGIHYMLNIVSGKEGQPQAVLIRGAGEFNGPGKLTKAAGIDMSFNYEDLLTSNKIWLEEGEKPKKIAALKRVGIGGASVKDQNRLWRYMTSEE